MINEVLKLLQHAVGGNWVSKAIQPNNLVGGKGSDLGVSEDVQIITG